MAAIKSGIEMGLFNGENGEIPRFIRKKLLSEMHLGDFLKNLYEDDLQSAAARRENIDLLGGNEVYISAYDDHELHIAEHRRAALDYSYRKRCRSDARIALALDRHIAEHEQKKGNVNNGTDTKSI